MTAARPAAIRRKVEAWLAEDDGKPAIALRARPDWPSDQEILPVAAPAGAPVTVRVLACRTPLAARAALHDRTDSERLVLLTDLNDAAFGEGLLAYFSQHRVRNVDPWEVTAQLFGAVRVDPALVSTGRWTADALIDLAPVGGWPPASGTTVTREHALRCLAAELLSLDRAQIDSAGLVQWSTDATAVQRLTNRVSPAVLDKLTGFLIEVAGPAAGPIMAAARAGHGADAVPLGLLAGVLWPASGSGPQATQAAAARARLEPRFGGARLNDVAAAAFTAAAEAWVDRTLGSGADADRAEGNRMLVRAETIAAEVDAAALLGASDLLPAGFRQRLHEAAEAIRAAVPAGDDLADPAAVTRAHAAVSRVAEHRGGDPGRTATAWMAVKLLRWLATPDDAAPATVHQALLRQVHEDGWVDRARLDVFAGDPDLPVAEAYHLLHRAVDARRARHDHRFAELLAAATAAQEAPGGMLRVEDVLPKLVGPILERGRRVLLLVLDGMSVAAATELAESVTASGAWLELTPAGGPRTGVLAALPTVTRVSRCSLLSGRIAVGEQAAEQAAFARAYPDGVLLHKGRLRARAGASFERDVVDRLADPETPLVAAVVNTIDDALDRSEPGTAVWGVENLLAVRDLLALAQDRVVVVVSDHGHVIDRGPEAVVRPSRGSENRWRSADTPAGDGEVLVRGPRVALAGGEVVLPWREEIRYGPRKAGYHGGASPAEAVIPLLVFSAGDEGAVPGWEGAPVASPSWWRERTVVVTAAEPTAVPTAERPRPAPRRSHKPRPEPLFDFPAASPPVEPAAAPPAPAAAPPDADSSAFIADLLASELYRQRKRSGSRTPLPDERVAALLRSLHEGNYRATLDTLAAEAGIPAHRIGGVITALRRLLQVEGYPVLTMDPDGQTVLLNKRLLLEQFRLTAT